MNAEHDMATPGNTIGRLKGLAGELTLRLLHRDLAPAFRVRSHLTMRERVKLKSLARDKEIVCEIGSYTGASACCFGAAMSRLGRGKVLCIDTWQNDAMTEGSRDTYAEFRGNTAAYSQYIVPLRGLSTSVADIVSSHAPHLDLLFIDGDHTYEGVKADWDTYERFLQPGSLVVFHDWGWAEGVRRVVEEQAVPRAKDLGMLPNLWWGTIAR